MKTQLNLTIDVGLVEKLKKDAEAEGQKISHVVEKVLREKFGKDAFFVRCPKCFASYSSLINRCPNCAEKDIEKELGERQTKDTIDQAIERKKKLVKDITLEEETKERLLKEGRIEDYEKVDAGIISKRKEIENLNEIIGLKSEESMRKGDGENDGDGQTK